MHAILIIEDDPLFRSMMETILMMEGFDVHSAENGESGLALLIRQRPDLILCDIMLPDIDGHTVLEKVRNRPEHDEDIPFVFVSGLSCRDDIRRGMAEGADDYLSKPFTAGELVAAVNGRLNRHKKRHGQTSRALFRQEDRDLLQKTTPREREILQLVGKGLSSKIIADRLGISQKTVEVHRANLMKKLAVANAVGLARWAVMLQQL